MVSKNCATKDWFVQFPNLGFTTISSSWWILIHFRYFKIIICAPKCLRLCFNSKHVLKKIKIYFSTKTEIFVCAPKLYLKIYIFQTCLRFLRRNPFKKRWKVNFFQWKWTYFFSKSETQEDFRSPPDALFYFEILKKGFIFHLKIEQPETF